MKNKEYIEGQKSTENFESVMRKLFKVTKKPITRKITKKKKKGKD